MEKEEDEKQRGGRSRRKESKRSTDEEEEREREAERHAMTHACITSPDLRFRNQRHNLGVLISGGCQHERK